MPQYKDINGDSGVESYEIGEGSITVHFERGGSYVYTNTSAGQDCIQEMQRLARNGDGLNTYINKHVRKNYYKKL